MGKTARALISVSDKTGLDRLRGAAGAAGIEILSTGGTARALRDGGRRGARGQRLHRRSGDPRRPGEDPAPAGPRRHPGAAPPTSTGPQMREHGLDPIDLVVVNLYPFRETVARGAPFDEVIENIDIGGPAMIRSAAKNHERVAVVVDPADYAPGARRDRGRRRGLGRAALRAGPQGLRPHRRLRRRDRRPPGQLHGTAVLERRWPTSPPPCTRSCTSTRVLRYGENPHQKAAFYASAGGARARRWRGPRCCRARSCPTTTCSTSTPP